MLSAVFSAFAAMSALLLLMTGWVLVQRAARRSAEQHPEFGPFRLVGGGCGGRGHGREEACASCEETSCKPATLA